MQKFYILPIFIALNAISIPAYAQNFYSTKTTKVAAAAPATTSPGSLSPEEFQSKMDSYGKQTDEYITSKVDAAVKKGESDNPIEAPPSSPTTGGGTTAVDKAAASMEEKNKAKPPAPTTTPAPATNGEVAPKPPAANPQPYTGFGTPDQGGSNTKSQGGDSNWNVGY